MRLPRFTGEFSIPPGSLDFYRVRFPVERAPCNVTAAMRDPNQQNYADCLAECRDTGGHNCAQRCAPSGTSTGSAGTNASPTVQCQVEEYTHPLGTIILDAVVRGLKDSGTVTAKSGCYTTMDDVALVGGLAATSLAGSAAGLWGGVIGAAVGYNLRALGYCICDRYF
jgi:hypothetical protein